ARRQADDQESRVLLPEARHRRIMPAGLACSVLGAESHQPRADRAVAPGRLLATLVHAVSARSALGSAGVARGWWWRAVLSARAPSSMKLSAWRRSSSATIGG